MSTAPDVPADAITAAMDELNGWRTDPEHFNPRRVVTDLLTAASLAIRAAERARILDLLDNWKCSCGEDDCSAYDARDEIASVIEGASRLGARTSKEGTR